MLRRKKRASGKVTSDHPTDEDLVEAQRKLWLQENADPARGTQEKRDR